MTIKKKIVKLCNKRGDNVGQCKVKLIEIVDQLLYSEFIIVEYIYLEQ